MKLFLALLLLGALAATAVLVPVSGETAWQHAERKGWPLAAAHGFARAANAGARWIAATLRGREDSHPAPPARSTRRRLARVPTAPGGSPAGSGIARAAPPAPPSSAPPASSAPGGGGRDRIVAAAPAERLDRPDRAALEKLITARAGR